MSVCLCALCSEPTSALDVESEALVKDALDRLVAGRTSVTIAHRLSTVMDASRVVTIADGRVVEDGTVQQLLAADGLFASMAAKQSLG